jgi:hypothetical protein
MAERITAGEYPLFGDTVALGAEPDWRRDWETGRASGLAYFKRVPYLASETVGDHKRIRTRRGANTWCYWRRRRCWGAVGAM